MSLITVHLGMVKPYGSDDVPVVASGRVEFTPTTHGKYAGAFRTIETVNSSIVQGVMDPVELTPGAWNVTVIPKVGLAWPTYTFLLTEDLQEPVNIVDLAPEIVIDGQSFAKGDQGPVGPAGPAPEVTWQGTNIVVDGEVGPDLRGMKGPTGAGKEYVDARLSIVQLGRNLWNPEDVTTGSIVIPDSSAGVLGAVVPSSAYDTSGFIYVESGKEYTMWGNSAVATGDPVRGPRAWVFYDTQKTGLTYGNDPEMSVQTLTAAQDGYVRVSFRREIAPNPMVEDAGTPTEYEPYTVDVPGLNLSITTEDLPDNTVTPDKTSFAVLGKNILNPDDFEVDTFLTGAETTTLPGYTTSGFVPVEGGKTYVGVVRMWSWYTAHGIIITSQNTGSNTAVSTQTAPTNAALMRASWSSSRTPIQQIEQGAVPTEYEPYGVRIPGLLVENNEVGPKEENLPVKVTKTDSELSVHTTLGDKPLIITGDLQGSRNGAYSFTGASLGESVHFGGTDDIAPIRTFNTVGANHGYTAISSIKAVGHGKTRDDLGSIWADSVNQWTLLLIDGDTLTVGPNYTKSVEGVVTAPSSPPDSDLTHVSGATNTSTITVSDVIPGAQLYPSVQRVHTTLLVGGQVVGDGEHLGADAQVRETYEVLDYSSIIDTARANIGVPFHELRVKGAIRVENTYTFRPGGVITVDTALTELTPTRLGSCGFVQAIRPPGVGGRVVPGVTGWTEPRPFSSTWDSDIITISDLIDPEVPPVMSLDTMDWGGFAIGYFPHTEGVTSSSQRIENGGANLWDLRSTQKSYPSPWMSKAAGWGRVEAHAYRVYLTPTQADKIVTEAEDAHAAHSVLTTITGL